jgi:hypothetical protein
MNLVATNRLDNTKRVNQRALVNVVSRQCYLGATSGPFIISQYPSECWIIWLHAVGQPASSYVAMDIPATLTDGFSGWETKLSVTPSSDTSAQYSTEIVQRMC